MGFWFNNFIDFERKRNRENRMILNFSYIPGDEEIFRSTKIYVPQKIEISSNFISKEKADNLTETLKKRGFNEQDIKRKDKSKYCILTIELSNNPLGIANIPKSDFQIGNYLKILKFKRFYPERKVKFSDGLETLFFKKKEIELENLDGIRSPSELFMSEPELKQLNYMILDIEKPLWKKDEEKEMIDEREKILKLERRYEKLKNKNSEDIKSHEARIEKINGLEKKLIYQTEGVGEIKLFEKQFNAEISFLTIIFGNKTGISKETYIIDPKKEIQHYEYEGYKLFTFPNEKNLLEHAIKRIKENNVLVSYGHNQSYDITQIRFAADEVKLIFDPAVYKSKPARDFVRYYMQRLKEDLIYIDTLWLNKIFHPYLAQKSFDTNLKLAGVADFYGISFEKSLTHEELRDVELKRLVGETKEIRQKAAEQMMYYAAKDVDVTYDIVQKMDVLGFLAKMKKLFPFCTYTEIAFSANCMNKLHEFEHYQKNRNLPYYGYKQKEREDELQIFKKRFRSIKGKFLRESGLQKRPNGEYGNVRQYYVPLEKWVKQIAFGINENIEKTYNETKENPAHHFAFLQYLKAYMNPVFADYYFAKREEKVAKHCSDFLAKIGLRADEGIKKVRDIFAYEERKALRGNLFFLKNSFRSVYVDLNGEDRLKILPREKNLLESDFPEIAEEDADIYLLVKNADSIKPKLKKPKNLATFLNNFRKFEDNIKAKEKNFKDYDEAFNLVYSDIYFFMAQNERDKFLAKYHLNLENFGKTIAEGYKSLADEIKNKGLIYLQNKGDYIFVQGDKEKTLDCCIKIRELESFVVE